MKILAIVSILIALLTIAVLLHVRQMYVQVVRMQIVACQQIQDPELWDAYNCGRAFERWNQLTE